MAKKKPASERKRAANGQGSISTRPDGRIKIDVSLGRDPVTGKAIRKSVYGWTEKEALAKAQKLTVEANEGIYKEPSKLTIKEWCEIWLKEYTGHLAPRTKTLYEGDINNYIVPRLGHHKLLSLNRAAVQQFVNSIMEQPLRPDKPVSAKTCKNIHGTLSRLLNQALEIDYIKVNPATRCKLPRIEREKARAMERQEIKDFIDRIQGDRFEHALLLALHAGLRAGEIAGLKWDAVNMDGGTITVKRQMQKDKGVYKLGPPKGNKVRVIHASGMAMDVLRRQKRQQAEWRLRAGAAWQDEGFVFTDEIGQHIKNHTLWNHFKRAAGEIGSPDLKVHGLRHTYATTSMQAGVDVKSIQENMGHYSSAFTLDQYGHAMKDVQKENAAKLDALFTGIIAPDK
ncbi:site-specific integrase [Eubacteriales bacterium OttesenSCG-928-A19]|nr:site-specific integrase [Eubacteriales bacterium OttesenSCG-928-A19]